MIARRVFPNTTRARVAFEDALIVRAAVVLRGIHACDDSSRVNTYSVKIPEILHIE